ncbi:hypothetical protein F443_19142 [Phytophthora nicotianae P1569]|uniref:Uncharacterized protein n=1 Tax=Phytophthora nicotianae P1569 TaxID=1317065 RepID=V9E733_PHYNI|nr:hypothetical protein F443_19142 [Phytophthora nicotianae P1569]
MGKSDINVTAEQEQEFASLEQVLNQTADDAARCLKLLKKNLSEYDSRHGNHFINTATSYMRSDMRTAKDTADDLKRVSHEINKCPQPSEAEIRSARNAMGATAKAMEVLNTTARNYDQKNGRSKGIKGAVDNALGFNEKEQHEKEGGFFGKSDQEKDNKSTGLFGSDKDDKSTGLFGSGDKLKDPNTDFFKQSGQDHGNENNDVILVDKSDRHHPDENRGGIFSGSDTVEALVKSTLNENFNLSALSHQITAAETSLSPLSPSSLSSPSTALPSLVERAKEMVIDVKDKLTGSKSSPTSEDLHERAHTVTP